MSVPSKKISIISRSRLIIAGTLLFQAFAVPARADDGDREILNQLYRDIIGSAPAAETISPDSALRPAGATAAASPSATGTPADDRLKNEIEKMVREAECRHDAAVKFMLDAR